MSPIRPPFLPVLREDTERVGTSEASHMLALVRYVTALPGEHNGRVDIDGEMWWQASHAEIADALGGTWNGQKVGRVIRKLEEAGELSSRSPDAWDGDQTKAYRVPSDQQCSNLNRSVGTASDLNRTASDLNRTASDMNRYRFRYEHSSSSTEELSEETEEIDYRASQAIARRDPEEIINAEVVQDKHPPTTDVEVAQYLSERVKRAEHARKKWQR